MSRTVTLTLYLYDELPTPKAKGKARDWMLDALRSSPDDSDYQKVLKKLRDLTRDELLAAIVTKDDCKLTGFYADHDALAGVEEALKTDPEAELDDLYKAADDAIAKVWESEQESWSETEYLEDTIRGNDYEFHENGKRAVYPK